MFILPKTNNQLPVIPDCQTCGALQKCKAPSQSWDHVKNPRKTVIVVDRPDSDVAKSLEFGEFKTLRALLDRVGGPSFAQFAIVPASACTEAGEGSWRHCLPLLSRQIKAINPEKIIVFGNEAMQSISKWLWGEDAGLYDRWYGHQIPCRELNAWICPVGYSRKLMNAEVSQLWAYRHMRSALRLSGRPYTKPPQYAKQYTLSYDLNKTRIMLDMAKQSSITAFDYETTGLKPEAFGHKIISCAVAWLQEDNTPHCVSFMVTPDSTPYLVDYLKSPVPKIAANLKFEERWSRQLLGTPVRSWCLDTVITAHMEDPGKTVAGLKFQAFARLGVPYYAGDVEPFFGSDGSNQLNQIHRVPTHKLLEYNALDSLSELDLGILQMTENGLSKKFYSTNLEFLRCQKKL